MSTTKTMNTKMMNTRTRMSAAQALTRAQLRELERELRSERARLERSMTTESGARSPTSAEEGLGLALASRTRARHATLVDALRRLESGTYGTCASCQSPIPYGRLLAMPEAAHCVTCGART
jgi:RNA polymerase-binding transcription factor DksA